jgi:branched-chain amino acid transport system permease protein
VVVGAISLSFINTYFLPDVLTPRAQDVFGQGFDLSELSFGIFGFLLVIMMLLRPQGLLPERRRQAELTEGLASDEALFEVQA